MSKKEIPPIQIVCFISDKLKLGLSGIRENYGHDDSTPFQADIFVYDKDNNPPGSEFFQKVGTIHNGGFGGPSEMYIVPRVRFKEYRDSIESVCRQHQMCYRGKPFASYSMNDLCESMAIIWLDATERKPSMRKQTVRYRFDDEPEVLKNKSNIFSFKE